MIKIYALDYPKVGNSGGWSKSAKHRPQPVLSTGETESVNVPLAGGKRRRKFTAFDMSTTPATLIRRDYALEDLRQLGSIPEFYFDEMGQLRNSADQIVMSYQPK